MSTRHWKVTSGSLEWKVNSASGDQVVAGGLKSTKACGATPAGSGRYSHVCVAGVSSGSSPASSVRTSNVCSPGLRLRTSCGYSQSSHASSLLESSRHSKTRSMRCVLSSRPV